MKKNRIKEWCISYYNLLMDLSDIFKKSNNEKRVKLVIDLVFLIIVTCVLKIPFIFIRNLGDNIISIFFSSNIMVLAIWGLIIELIYAIVALIFFMKTLKKWINKLD